VAAELGSLGHGTEQERRVHPAFLDRVGQMLREVLDGRGTTRESLQRGLEIAHEPSGVDLEMAQDAVHIRVRQVDDLKEPVTQIDVGVAPQLAECHRAFSRLEHERVELAEQGRTADLGHCRPLLCRRSSRPRRPRALW